MPIQIRNCSTNNLKNISLDIPFNKITCVSGASGSGKSSLVFHTLANESKRRFLNSLPSGVTFFDRVPQSADVEVISPVLPVWVLAQSNPIVGSRLNLLDQFELTMDLAQLYFDNEQLLCPIHRTELSDSFELFEKEVQALITKDSNVLHFLIDKEQYGENISGLPLRSYNGESKEVGDFDEDQQYWELFRIKAKSLAQLRKKLLEFSFISLNPILILVHTSEGESKFVKLGKDKECLSCLDEGIRPAKSVDELIPFNGVGACGECRGYGSVLEYSRSKLVKYPSLSIEEGAISIMNYSTFSSYQSELLKELKKKKVSLKKPFSDIADSVWPILMNGQGSFPGVMEMISWLEEKKYKRSVRIFLRSIQVDRVCSACEGTRINSTSSRYLGDVQGLPVYGELLKTNVETMLKTIENLDCPNKDVIRKRILNKLELARELGLGKFDLAMKLRGLETNEYQKSLLVRYLSYKGSGSLFILDEPSLSLDSDEQKVLIKYLKILSKENTVVLVDHSSQVQKASDLIVEIGPGAGHLGGEITYIGKYKASSIGKRATYEKPPKGKGKLVVKNIEFENKKIKKIEIPQRTVSVISSYLESFSKRLIGDVVANDIHMNLFGEKLNYDTDYKVGGYNKFDEFDDILIYKTSVERASGRSSVGTMLGLSPHVRKYFASLAVSKNLGLKDGHFSPNSDLGKCQACDGKGVKQIDMSFLEDVTYPCEECEGKKLNKFYANISDGKITAHEAYQTPISELYENLPTTPKIRRVLDYLKLLNLDYLTLDRTLPSLSGGERLRIKFLNTLQKNIENSMLIFSNLSYGLSTVELAKVRELLIGLGNKGNTIILVDNHPIFKDFNKIDVIVE